MHKNGGMVGGLRSDGALLCQQQYKGREVHFRPFEVPRVVAQQERAWQVRCGMIQVLMFQR